MKQLSHNLDCTSHFRNCICDASHLQWVYHFLFCHILRLFIPVCFHYFLLNLLPLWGLTVNANVMPSALKLGSHQGILAAPRDSFHEKFDAGTPQFQVTLSPSKVTPKNDGGFRFAGLGGWILGGHRPGRFYKSQNVTLMICFRFRKLRSPRQVGVVFYIPGSPNLLSDKVGP